MKSLFLSGYGLSIKVKDTRMVFSQGSSAFTEKQEPLEIPVSKCSFDKVIIQGKGFVSTEALERLAESNINVIMLDKRGKLYSYFHQIGGHEPLVRQKQYQSFHDEKKLEHLRKWIVSGKIQSQIDLFKELVAEQKIIYNSYNKAYQTVNNQHSSFNYSSKVKSEIKEKISKSIANMEKHLSLLDSARTLREIIKIESDVAKLYYPIFSKLFREKLEFSTRNNQRTFRPSNASDVINSLLNYGFSILYAEVAKQLNGLGLDCFVGFYHKNHDSHLALVYDMIEPFRHLIDRSVFEIQDSIKNNDYAYSRHGIVVLSDDLKKRYIELLSSVFNRKKMYSARSGIRRSDGYQKMEEITIMKMKCIELKEHLIKF